MTGAELKRKLHAGERVYATCVVSTSPVWPAMIAQTGVDFVFIDTEHIPMDRNQLSWMCQTFNALGLPPLVRIPACDPALANMAIDAGGRGVVSPYCESVEEVQILRGATKYRPLKGIRLAQTLSGEVPLEEPTKSYIADMNQHNLTVVNIESVKAIDRLDEICAVPDVDALLIGPHDLSINMDIPEDYSNPKFTEAIRRIIEAGRNAGIGVGYHYSFGIEQTQLWAEMGANLIVHSSDYFLTKEALTNDLKKLRTALGDPDPLANTGDDEGMVTI
jgi:2-keto-3-deoxy-L-rhamnonate aldolase RhmA